MALITSKKYGQFAGLMLVASLICHAYAQDLSAEKACFANKHDRFDEVLACYRQAQAAKPLQYEKLSPLASDSALEQSNGVEIRRFKLHSQSWSPDNRVEPALWEHDVFIIIPTGAYKKRALLIANNGRNHPTPEAPYKPANNFSEATAIKLAKDTRTIVVSVSNIPNQALTYTGESQALLEDRNAAHSWKLFLENPKERPFMPLQIPMMESLVKTMDLAVAELKKDWRIDRFIATGVSKRAWAVWLAAISDSRIEAIAPFVLDILDMQRVLTHTYKTYGQRWPFTFKDYQAEGITAEYEKEISGPQQEKLLNLQQILDPLSYLQSPYAARLEIPKYIISASGDEFFTPDNSIFYFNLLPGQKALNVIPNTGHYIAHSSLEKLLPPFIARIHASPSKPLASVTIIESQKKAKANQPINDLSLRFSEPPVQLTRWTATNPNARDFRYACGIRYSATELTPTQSAQITLTLPPAGAWQATFIEARFADDFVITTPVYVLPKTYPPEKLPKGEMALCEDQRTEDRGQKTERGSR